MIEEVAKDAFSNVNQNILGSVLIIYIFISGLAFRWLNGYLIEAKNDLKAEREAHQRTREAQIADIRNLANVANSVESLRSTMDAILQRGQR